MLHPCLCCCACRWVTLYILKAPENLAPLAAIEDEITANCSATANVAATGSLSDSSVHVTAAAYSKVLEFKTWEGEYGSYIQKKWTRCRHACMDGMQQYPSIQ